MSTLPRKISTPAVTSPIAAIWTPLEFACAQAIHRAERRFLELCVEGGIAEEEDFDDVIRTGPWGELDLDDQIAFLDAARAAIEAVGEVGAAPRAVRVEAATEAVQDALGDDDAWKFEVAAEHVPGQRSFVLGLIDLVEDRQWQLQGEAVVDVMTGGGVAGNA